MMWTKEREDSISEILEEQKIDVSKIDIKSVTEDIAHHFYMEQEQHSYQFVGVSKSECSDCKRLENEIKDLKNQLECYKNSVKKRRNADEVWLEDGRVKYQ